MTETTKRILVLMQKKNLNAHQLEIAVNLPNASVQSWTKGKRRKNGELTETTPSSDSIAKLARYFNVSADYLLCLTDEPTPLNAVNIAERPTAELLPVLAQLSNDRDFVNSAKLYNAVSTECKKQICAYILGIASALGVNISQVLGR